MYPVDLELWRFILIEILGLSSDLFRTHGLILSGFTFSFLACNETSNAVTSCNSIQLDSCQYQYPGERQGSGAGLVHIRFRLGIVGL